MDKSILVVDDDGLVAQALKKMLISEGYYAKSASSGYEAFEEIIGDAHFDLIICDIRMPGLNGVETVKMIEGYLKHKGLPEVPAIFITGYPDDPVTAQAQKYGKVICKPFATHDFLTEVMEELSDLPSTPSLPE